MKGRSLSDKWILARLNGVTGEVTHHLEKYQFGLAVEALQQFIWSDFADWYVEIHKVEKNTAVLRHVLRQSLILLHPFAPFITEAIWSALEEKRLLIIEPWPKVPSGRSLRPFRRGLSIIPEFKNFQRLVIGLRNLKIHGANNQPLSVQPTAELNRELLTKLSGIAFSDQAPTDAARLTIADEQLMAGREVVERYSSWRTKERQQLEQYIAQKQKLAANDKAPSHIREQAGSELLAARARLQELE